VPVDTVVRETVVGIDVIHGWWIPALSPQLDAIPGRVNHTWFRADKVGIYKGQCAQLCGVFHAKMAGAIDVVTRPQFDAFLASHSAGSRTVAAEAYVGVCSKCHGMNGKGAYGPALQGRTFEPNDITRLFRHGRTTALGMMPAVGSNWSQAQVAAMIRYLQQTKGAGSGGG
jgi:cytochrome c553